MRLLDIVILRSFVHVSRTDPGPAAYRWSCQGACSGVRVPRRAARPRRELPLRKYRAPERNRLHGEDHAERVRRMGRRSVDLRPGPGAASAGMLRDRFRDQHALQYGALLYALHDRGAEGVVSGKRRPQKNADEWLLH